jgi:hypothetical protein
MEPGGLISPAATLKCSENGIKKYAMNNRAEQTKPTEMRGIAE